ncbi:WBC30 protein, partial [Zosterops hypoxanthus]|nr:WBC30 protein [Zosterops hypoxanthus]
FYCSGGAQSPTPMDGLTGAPCPLGHFCPQGSRRPQPCPPGSHGPHSRGQQCQPCPQGHYCEFFCPKNSSSILEKDCPSGHYCPAGTASAAQFPCPSGTYNPRAGSSRSSQCRPCEPGHFCALPGQSQVSGPCLAGFYCTGGAASPSPRDGLEGNLCPQGSYCPLGSAFPLPCPPGHYSSSTGNTGSQDCLLCDAGKA